MALKTHVGAIVCGLALLPANPAAGQSIAVELDQSAGYSTEDVRAVHTKLHAFGEAPHDFRFNLASVWGKQSEESDAFGVAYPYTDHPVVLDAYAERTFRPAGRLLGVRIGRYRTPFGISSESDQGYVGFQRDPLIRYDDFFALSSTFYEHGADVIVGSPRLSLEASLGASADVGEHTRSAGFDNVLRAQTVAGSFIVGASYIHTRPHLAHAALHSAFVDGAPIDLHPPEEEEGEAAEGHAMFGGVDVRWMRGGVQLRGEFIAGRPFDGARTHGGYVDAIVHRPFMGPVTAALRAERLAHVDASIAMLNGERYTAATRIRLVRGFIAHAEVVHNSRTLPQRRATSIDLGLSYSLRIE